MKPTTRTAARTDAAASVRTSRRPAHGPIFAKAVTKKEGAISALCDQCPRIDVKLAKPFGSGMRAWNLWRHSKGLFNFCPSVSSVITHEARSRLRQSIAAFRAFATFRTRRFTRFDISAGPFHAGCVESANAHIGMACPGAPVLQPVGLSYQQSHAYRSRAMLLRDEARLKALSGVGRVERRAALGLERPGRSTAHPRRNVSVFSSI